MVVDQMEEATYNIPYEMIIPQINTMEPTGTTIHLRFVLLVVHLYQVLNLRSLIRDSTKLH